LAEHPFILGSDGALLICVFFLDKHRMRTPDGRRRTATLLDGGGVRGEHPLGEEGR
jgi:hypothetical protein